MASLGISGLAESQMDSRECGKRLNKSASELSLESCSHDSWVWRRYLVLSHAAAKGAAGQRCPLLWAQDAQGAHQLLQV